MSPVTPSALDRASTVKFLDTDVSAAPAREVGGGALDTAGATLLFEAPAQLCTTPDGTGTVDFAGCFRLLRLADGSVRGCLYGDPDTYFFLPPDGLYFSLILLRGPLELIGEQAFKCASTFPREQFMRFHMESDAQSLARIWAENL